MEREVQRELLDDLPPDDRRAIGSRRDLRRLNAWMRNARTLARWLEQVPDRNDELRLTDLGGGDGATLLSAARRLRGRWRTVNATIVDQQHLLCPTVQRGFREIGWSVSAEQDDVFHWFERSPVCDVVAANLFLHHFSNDLLRRLFGHIAAGTDGFIAIEPRRRPFTLFCSRFVGLVGCNSVTRHDAVASVRAGFVDRELSALWPDPDHWNLHEMPAGWSSHVFVARRKTHSRRNPC